MPQLSSPPPGTVGPTIYPRSIRTGLASMMWQVRDRISSRGSSGPPAAEGETPVGVDPSVASERPVDGWVEPSSERALGGFGQLIAEVHLDQLDKEAVRFIRMLLRRGSVAPKALDIGCGAGAQALRMAEAGGYVLASDLFAEYGRSVERYRQEAELPEDRLKFQPLDLRSLPDPVPDAPFDLVVCQRVLHYLTYDEAVAAVRELGKALTLKGRLYVSVAGLASELSNGYPALGAPVRERFALLHPNQRVRHQCERPVCLYSPDELRQMLREAGLEVSALWISRFGHIKAIARRPHAAPQKV